MIRLIIFLLILGGLDVYFHRVVKYFWTSKKMLRLYWSINLLSYVILGLYFFFDLRNSDIKFLAVYPGAWVFIWYFSKFAALPLVLLENVVTLLKRAYYRWVAGKREKIAPSKVMLNLALGLFLLPVSTMTYGILWNPHRHQIHKIELEIEGLDPRLEGFKIVQLSDIHAGTFVFRSPLKRAVQRINDLSADVFVFTGDLVNTKSSEIEPYLSIFAQIEAPYGKFSVLGNHDYGDYYQWPNAQSKKDNFQEMLIAHEKLGWDLLRNEYRSLDYKGAPVHIVGVENFSAIPRFPRYGDLEASTECLVGEKGVKILLTHDPTHWKHEVVPRYKDILLTLSGHTHGFQFGIEIPGWFAWSPSQLMYAEWAGLYETQGQFLYVNRGFGVLGYPGRVGILPEITEITFKKK
jgi:uncharacterized protein